MAQFLRDRRFIPELLDAGRAPDADVAASLADLRRINRYLGGQRVLRLLLREQVARTGLGGFRLLDVGSGSADLPAAIRCWYPASRVVALDLHARHLTLHDFSSRVDAGPVSPGGDPAAVSLVAGDVFALPFPLRSFDFVTASLFLHHFPDDRLPDVLRCLAGMARRAVLVNDLDRHWIPLLFLHAAAPVFARSPITRYDAAASIRQAFKRGELRAAATRAGFQNAMERWHFPFRRSLVIELDRT